MTRQKISAVEAHALTNVAKRVQGRKVIDLEIGGREQGRRAVRWRDEYGRRYSFRISANPHDVDTSKVEWVRFAPRLGAEMGDPEWFNAEEFSTSVKRWRDLVAQVWETANMMRLISPAGYADADAKRIMAADVYRRSGEIFDALAMIITAHDLLDPADMGSAIRRAKDLRDEIQEAGRLTFEKTKRDLERIKK